MARRTRADMEQTRATLLETARLVFSERGYADTSMDDLTAQANLTRGALYHHFGDKKGLLAAVVAQIDSEMDARLQALSDAHCDPWLGFTSRCRAYLEMAREPEIQRIVLRDARAVLGTPSPQAQMHCVQSLKQLLEQLMALGLVIQVDPQALASMISGGLTETAFWIAEGDKANDRLPQALIAMERLLNGIRL
ncbi:TetR/AcrR family transcriptional regulator [Pseudomonas sp. H9]|uniref:TetR/AcrR family transcriptional regulator n=1 Tax=Pseudomonas sp. H9 TaxID=483968 RepID=UPI001057632C|nr:TetR/AcrR family transcriptional regulator [Pseudomonas sp. H9]TDF86198.1 TetR family transcriptional regulator [Pseudomonas sp. H9]